MCVVRLDAAAGNLLLIQLLVLQHPSAISGSVDNPMIHMSLICSLQLLMTAARPWRCGCSCRAGVDVKGAVDMRERQHSCDSCTDVT